MKHICLQLHITGNCNLRCKHCYISEHSVEMSYCDVKKVLCQFDNLIKELKRQYKEPIAAHIHITGGEPLLHSDITKILLLLRRNRHKYRIGIMSNGTLLNTSNLLLLKSLHLKAFQVSIDGGEKLHDSIRGQGNLKKVIDALDLLNKWKIPTRVSFTANKLNYKDFPKVAEMCRQHKVSSLWSDRYIPFEHNTQIPPLDKADTEEYVHILEHERKNEENKRYGLDVQNYRALQFLCSKNNPYYCHAGETLITVDEHGNILPCRRLPINCGNIKSSSLADVYFNNEVFIDLRNHSLNGKCIKCAYAKTCKGGERCFTYAVSGTYNLPDPCCWINE